MINIKNMTDQPIRATTGHEIKANGKLSVSAATWDRLLTEPYIAGQVKRGNLVAERAAVKPKAKPAAKKAEAPVEEPKASDEPTYLKSGEAVAEGKG